MQVVLMVMTTRTRQLFFLLKQPSYLELKFASALCLASMSLSRIVPQCFTMVKILLCDVSPHES